MVSEKKIFENVDGLTDGRRTTDGGRTTDAGVIGILIAHLGAFGSGELKTIKTVEYPAMTFQYIRKVSTVLEGTYCQL